MNLPTPALPSGTIELDGTPVEYRSLSRSQVLRMQKYDGDPDAAEDYLLACALDMTIEDVRAWRNGVTVKFVAPLVAAVISISGLDKLDAGAVDPKD